MNRCTQIIFLLLSVNLQLWGQRIVPTPDDLYTDATEFMYSGDYRDALDILLTLHSKGYRTANISYLIGECYLNINGLKISSIPFLKEAAGNISVNYSGKTIKEEYAPSKTLLYLGIAYRLNYDFDTAMRYFREYINNLNDSEREQILAAGYHVDRCNYARELMASPAVIRCDTVGMDFRNSIPCFNPLVTPDEKTMMFMEQLKFYDAVICAHKSGIKWSSPENLTPLIKSDGDHSITGISSTGNQLFLMNYDPYTSGDIYTTEFNNGEWSPVRKLDSPVNTVFNETHASISPDGSVLYFTSDRKGGYGGTDIYRAEKNERNEWEKPVNLGPLINTPFNEATPFVSSDGSRLFFSSQGHYNMGGYDIFCSSLDGEGDWFPPVNIGFPLNTTDDDLFFFPLGNGQVAYQSRFPLNSSGSELVRFEITSFGKPERFMINGKVDIHADPGFNPSSISVAFIEKQENDTLAIKLLNEDGSFRQKLSAGNYKIDFSFDRKQLLSRELIIPEYLPYNNLVFHEEIGIPTVTAGDTIYLKDILFEFNTVKPREDYLADIDKISHILYRYPEATVRILGYADAIGSNKFNLGLSLKRAQIIKEILENQLGKTLRTITVPNGENGAIAVNRNADGTDNPQGRQYNRRVQVVFEDLPDNMKVVNVNEVPADLKLKSL